MTKRQNTADLIISVVSVLKVKVQFTRIGSLLRNMEALAHILVPTATNTDALSPPAGLTPTEPSSDYNVNPPASVIRRSEKMLL